MTTDPELQYWDSCMFISLLPGKDAQRSEIIKALLQQEGKGLIKIAVSTFVSAEVRPDESNPGLDPNQFQMAVELLESGRLDPWVLTEKIAQDAQKIGQLFPKLLPGDCVHIATALAANAAVLFTFDGVGPKRRRPAEMIAHSEKIGSQFHKPPLKICEPFLPVAHSSDPLFKPDRVIQLPEGGKS
jgi:predicted nucleic acid-binding protein